MAICFGLRGFDEHRQMCLGDVTLELEVDTEGIEYVLFIERQTKTRQSDTNDCWKIKPRRVL